MAGLIYIATSLHNTERGQQIRDKFKALGVAISYDWQTHGQLFDEEELINAGLAEEEGVRAADVLFFITPGRFGSHVEFGLARAWNKPIVMLIETVEEMKPFYLLPGVKRFTIEQEAIDYTLALLKDK